MPSLRSPLPRLPLLVLFLFLAIGCSTALLPSEQRALEDLLVAFPRLSSIPLGDTVTQDASGSYYSLGLPWTSDVSKTCENSDGYDILGVYCSGGSVVALLIQPSYWGEPLAGSSFSHVSGLVHLQNITYGLDNSTLLEALLQTGATSLSLQSLSAPVSDALQFGCSNLTSISISAAVPSTILWGNCTSLQSLEFSASYTGLDLSPLAVLGPTLKYLDVRGQTTTNQDALTSLTNLESVILYTKRFTYVPAVAFPRLSSLVIWSNNPYTLSITNTYFPSLTTLKAQGGRLQVDSFADSISTLYFYSPYVTITAPTLPSSLVSLTVHVTTFVIRSPVNLFAGTPKLDYFGLLQTSNISAIPPWDLTMTSLTKFRTTYSNFTINGADKILCALPASLLSIDLSFSTGFSVLPPCFNNGSLPRLQSVTMPNLGPGVTLNSWQLLNSTVQTLDLSNSYFNLSQSQWPQFVARFPNLQSLKLTGNSMAQPFPRELLQLSNLTELRLNNNAFSGTLPALGNALPNLAVVDISGNAFEGSIDLNGLSKLTSFVFDNNDFLDFPTPSTPAPVSLDSIVYTSSALKSIPSNDWLAQLRNLSQFALRVDPLQRLPFPTFWTTLPSLTRLDLSGGGFLGALPSMIDAPKLNYLYLSGGTCSMALSPHSRHLGHL